MQFSKPPATAKEHIELLRDRGLIFSPAEEPSIYAALARIGYYRLTGYMLPFQLRANAATHHIFKPNVHLTDVMRFHDFDTKLRSHALAGLQIIEIAFRSRLCSYLAGKYGAHW